MEQNTVFISYRRAMSKHLARSIYMDLKAHGWDSFLDVNTIDSGDFDRIILNQIGARAHFILIISPDSFVRCANVGDWVLREIEEAVRLERNIVPIIDEGVDFNREMGYLPDELRSVISKKNSVPLVHFYFDEALEKLRNRFLKTPEYITLTEPPVAERLEVQRRMASVDTPTTSTKPKHDNSAVVRAIIGEPFEWCEVPAGDFLYGDDKKTLTLPKFSIAKYPITYSQFQTFLDAKDGFSDPRWWEELAASADHRKTPGDQQFKIANHPREKVSWYDAIAFCRWLSAQVGGGYDVTKIGDWALRLPTEFEWEKAARGTKGLVYPYGNEFDKDKCNSGLSDIGKTTPVTQYPQGASPYRALDMSGNVWEWCLTDYSNPQQDALKENISSDKSRVLRGGSWINSNTTFLRGANRYFVNPVGSDYNIGLRCARFD